MFDFSTIGTLLKTIVDAMRDNKDNVVQHQVTTAIIEIQNRLHDYQRDFGAMQQRQMEQQLTLIRVTALHVLYDVTQRVRNDYAQAHQPGFQNQEDVDHLQKLRRRCEEIHRQIEALESGLSSS
jgi:hypothetical protein